MCALTPNNRYGTGPLGSQSQSSSTLSFKTDINRQKTRRWVEAKSVSYDGDDWGDDDLVVEEEVAPSATTPAASSDHRLAAISEARESLAEDGAVSQQPRDDSEMRTTTGGEQTRGSSTEPSSLGRPADSHEQFQEQSSGTVSSKPAPVDHGQQESSPAPASSAPAAQASEPVASTQTEEKSLQRDPSLGFRSVVHQAFDAQDTPTSMSDDISRSDSVSTSVISPIIPRSGLDTDKTKTIEEHPDEADTNGPPPGFRPGHRRDLSLPGSENDASKRATIVDGQQAPEPQLAQTVTVPPAQSHEGQVSATGADEPIKVHDQQPAQDLDGTAGSQLHTPMPLRIPEGQTHNALESAPPSVGTEASPQEMESDRLRREIIRSLSPDPQQASRPASRTFNESHASKGEAPHLPSDGEHGIAPPDPLRIKSPAVPQAPADVAPVPSEPVPAPEEDTRPMLTKRFSWEESSNEADNDAGVAPNQRAVTSGVSPSESPGQDVAAPTTSASPEEPKDVPASSEGANSGGSEAAPRPPVEATAAQSQSEPPLRTFKQIMEIKSPEEKIRAFKETREQFASMDTGLSEWLRRSSESLQDHADLVQLNGEVPGGAPARALPQRTKFPKLSSFGNLSLSSPSLPSTSQTSGTHGHVRRPSAPLAGKINMQNMESKGKDLLHSAGMLGGKAGGAARGLFAKGKSKLRSTTDKVD